jgi:hypothetical protein
LTIKVIGAGFGRTGTLSLKYALEKLGYDKCYHMLEVRNNPGHTQAWVDTASGKMPDWHELFAGYQASVDWPSCNFWREQMAAFPEAKVILSRRDPDDWYKSVMNTIYPSSVAGKKIDTPEAKLASRLAFEVIWDSVFDGRMEDKAHVIACYEAHNQEVIEKVPADKLLVYQPGDGWAPLCAFLGHPVPDDDYPRVNSTDDFKAMMKEMAAQASDKT